MIEFIKIGINAGIEIVKNNSDTMILVPQWALLTVAFLLSSAGALFWHQWRRVELKTDDTQKTLTQLRVDIAEGYRKKDDCCKHLSRFDGKFDEFERRNHNEK